MAISLVFDVNGTLLDTAALTPTIRAIFGASLSVDQWFSEVLLYSMATSLAGDYRDFGDIAISVLRMAASARGFEVHKRDEEKVRQLMRQLPPYPEVKRSLRRLKAANCRLAALSNSGTASLDKQLQNAGLSDFFEQTISVEVVGCFKPAPSPYQAAARALGIEAGEIIMVAAHPWDLLGAARAGCRTAFVRRPGKALFPDSRQPDYVARDLTDLTDQVLGKRESSRFPLVAAGIAVLVIGGFGRVLAAGRTEHH